MTCSYPAPLSSTQSAAAQPVAASKPGNLAETLRDRSEQIQARLAARLAEKAEAALERQAAEEQARRMAAEDAAARAARLQAKLGLASDLQASGLCGSKGLIFLGGGVFESTSTAGCAVSSEADTQLSFLRPPQAQMRDSQLRQWSRAVEERTRDGLSLPFPAGL